MNKISFIYRIWRRLFRNHIDVISGFVDSNSTGFSSAPATFDRLITTTLYNIDSNIEFFIRNGNSKFIR